MNVSAHIKYNQKHVNDTKTFYHLNLIFMKNSKCIVFLWVHRTQLYLYLVNLIKSLATLKLI